MNKKVVRLLSCFIPVKKWRKMFRKQYGSYSKNNIDSREVWNNVLVEIQNLRENISSLQFKMTIFLNHYVDIKKVIPAGGGMRQVQLKRLKVLNFIVDILEREKIDYWLDGGTLLGAVRHNSFIPWDDDIDIGIKIEDLQKVVNLVENSLKLENKYKIIDAAKLRNFPPGCFYKIVGVSDNYEFLDIFAFGISQKYQKAVYKIWWEKSLSNSHYISKPPLHMSIDTLFPLSEIEFEHRVYKAPCNPLKYVELQYGNYQAFPDKPYERGIESMLRSKYTEVLEKKDE